MSWRSVRTAELRGEHRLEPEAWEALVPHFERDLEGLDLLASSRRTKVARCPGPRPLVIKRYQQPRALSLRTFLRASLAAREVRAYATLRAVLPAQPVEPLAWAEARRLGCVRRSWIVTAELEGSAPLRRPDELPPADQALARRLLTEDLPRDLAALHGAGLFAAGLRAKNLLLQPAEARLALLDLPRLRRPWWGLRLSHRRLDLGGLGLTLAPWLGDDWPRLLAAYAAAAGLDPARLDAARVARASDRLASRTPLRAALRRLRKGAAATAPVEALTGLSYSRPEGE